MRVWLPQDLNATNPSQPETLASQSKVSSSSERMPALSAINDRLVPKDENDRSVPYTHWWPKKDCTEWLGYEFPQEATVQSATVYWYDDGPWGGCRVPQSWRILHSPGASFIRTSRDSGSPSAVPMPIRQIRAVPVL